MRHRPPKGIDPPQLAGRRTGRPRGTKNHAKGLADALWGWEHRYEESVVPPSTAALWWYRLGCRYPDELQEFLEAWGVLDR